MSPILRQLAAAATNLGQGARLITLRSVEPRRLAVSGQQLLLLLGMDLALSLAGSWLTSLPQPFYNPAGWGSWALGLALTLGAVYALTSVLGRDQDWLRAAILAVSALFWLDAARVLIDLTLPAIERSGSIWIGRLVLLAGWLWIAVIGYRLSVLIAAAAPARRLASIGLWLAIFLLGALLLPGVAFWERDYGESARWARYRAVDVERVYYAQRPMLERLTTALEPGLPGRVDLYFLGFASYATEDVFFKEIGFVHELFDRRFATSGRSLRLVNSLETLERLPLANVSNLRIALDAIAAKMNPDEDVLFLYLTSHGSPDHELAVRFWPLRLNDFPAAILKTLLDDAGIRYRVIVVSACYSGGFIDAVKDQSSLIITAARRDRTSFGCGHEQNFTYFGEAFFAEALELEPSFVEAFRMARERIASRERAEGLEPSLPQMHLGQDIVPVLETLSGGRR